MTVTAPLRTFAALFALAACLLAYSPRKAEAALAVEIIGAGSQTINVVQATPLGGSGAALQRGIANNMAIIPFVNQINPQGIPGGASVSSSQPSAQELERFLLAKAHLIITSNWAGPGQVELRCFEVAGGRFLFGNRYAVGAGEGGVLDVADKFCDDFLEALIGRGAFFRSPLAFVKTGGQNKKDIWTVMPNGRKLAQITNVPGESLSPSWSPDGRRIIFSHISKRSHGLGVVDLATRSARRVNFPNSTVIGPAFLPSGGIAVSLSDGIYPSIYLLDGSFNKKGKLASSSGIDVSPSVDASGRLMAFTSSRLGGPQIFVQGLGGGGARRVSQAGGYNTDPSISPDGTLVAYARQMGGGHKIFVQDLATGEERQVSSGPGSDEEPTFAPDGYFIVFMSTRSGKKQLYVTTRYGGEVKRIPTGKGDAAFPAFGPVAKR